MHIRKNKVIDGVDRQILRVLYIQGSLVSREIAKNIGISSSAISPRLENLKEMGIIKQSYQSSIRKFRRKNKGKQKTIISPIKKIWKIDLK